MDLGGSWAPFGRSLGRSGAPFGRSWASLGCFGGVLSRAFLKHGPKMGSKRPSGSIWGRFWRVLGGFGEDLGRNLGRVWKHLALLGQILYLDPRADPRSVTIHIFGFSTCFQSRPYVRTYVRTYTSYVRTYVRTYGRTDGRTDRRRRIAPGPRPPPIPHRGRACRRILYREVTSSVPPLQ